MKRSAVIDPTGHYRYFLTRSWEDTAPCIGFVMLNPSTADHEQDDPTLRRCLGFAKAWGYGSLEVVNLFAYRATTPQLLRQAPDPIGPENDDYLIATYRSVSTLVLAWGNWGTWQNRDRAVISLLSKHPSLCCLGRNCSGHPRHPLYLRRDVALTPF